MADNISRSDIQQAVKAELHGIRNDVSRISHVLDGMNRLTRDVQDLVHRMQSLERNVNQIQNTVINTLGNSQGKRHPDPRIAAMWAEMHEVKVRFSAVEKFAAQMSDFMRKRYEQTEDDRSYRTA